MASADADTIAKAARAGGLEVFGEPHLHVRAADGERWLRFNDYRLWSPTHWALFRCALHDGLRAKGYRIEYHNDTATGRPAVDIIHQDDAMGDRTLSTWEADNDIDALIEAASKLEEA